MTPAIELKNVSFAYPNSKELVLDGISCDIKQGEFVGIVGPNGGGKTTFLRLITGLEKPSKGEILIEGTLISSFTEKYRIGYVPQRIAQEAAQFPVTVQEVVASGRVARQGIWSVFGTTNSDAVDQALEITDLKKLRNRNISTLSGGQKQRVYIARAIAAEPQILLLDEPTVGVDAASQKKFYEFLGMIHKSLHLTILFVTHDLDLIVKAADHVLCINKELLCHLPSHEFHKHDYMNKVYGDQMIEIHHHH